MALDSPPHPFTRSSSTVMTATWKLALAVVAGCALAFAAEAEADGTLQTDAAVLRAVARSNPSFNRSWVETDPCLWTGVECSNSRVTALSLNDSEVTGPIPKELANLTSLQTLYLPANFLSGPIPAELGGLKSLQSLELSFNFFLTGPIPKELGNLASLQSLRISFTRVSGQIPEEIGNLTSLTYLELMGNNLSGPIPYELGRLISLQHLLLRGDQLSGPIPWKLGSLRSLKTLILSQNQLSGPIPRELSSLKSLKLLDLSSNQLSGPIPKQLASLSCLGLLHLSSNRLSGPIPKEFGSFTSLETLELSDNQLSGPIPGELGSLTSLHNLNLSSNHLHGPIPKQLARLCSAKIHLGCIDDLSAEDLDYVCTAVSKHGGPDFVVDESCRRNCLPASMTMVAVVLWRLVFGMTGSLVMFTAVFGSKRCSPPVNEQPSDIHSHITTVGSRKYARGFFLWLGFISLDVITCLKSTQSLVGCWSMCVVVYFIVWPPWDEQSGNFTSATGFCKYAWGLLSLGSIAFDSFANMGTLAYLVRSADYSFLATFIFWLFWNDIVGALMLCMKCKRKHSWPLFPLWESAAGRMCLGATSGFPVGDLETTALLGPHNDK